MNNENKRARLLNALRHGDYAAFDDMIDHSEADINDKGELGETLLHVMTAEGGVLPMLHLIKRGADVNAKDDRGETPLIWAMNHEQGIAGIVLAKAQKDINAEVFDGKAALHLAVERGWILIVFALIKAGADVNAKSKDGKTALEIAKENNKENPLMPGDEHRPMRKMMDLLRLAMDEGV